MGLKNRFLNAWRAFRFKFPVGIFISDVLPAEELGIGLEGEMAVEVVFGPRHSQKIITGDGVKIGIPSVQRVVQIGLWGHEEIVRDFEEKRRIHWLFEAVGDEPGGIEKLRKFLDSGSPSGMFDA